VINLVVLRVADLERSRRFYECLGVRFARERHAAGPEHLAADLGGTVFELYPDGGRGPTAGLRLGFRVPCVDAATAAAREAGADVLITAADGPWGRRAVVADPDGIRVELTSPFPEQSHRPDD
jgi:lactoylglutathione lyase